MSAKKSERSFGLSSENVAELAAEYAETKQFPNPYRAGAYGFTIDALVKLGVNKPHSLAKVHQAFKRAAGAEWYDDWAGSEKRNKATGKDADARFLQNLGVLQRTKDYGLKLLQVGQKVLKSKGAVINISRDSKGALLVALNLDSNKPLKPGRSEKPTKPAAQKAAKGSGKPQVATGGKGKAKGAAKRRTPQAATGTPPEAVKAE